MSIIHKIILYHLAQHNYAFVTTVAKNLVKEDNVLLYWSVQLATYIYSLVQVIIWHCTWLFHIKTVPAETTKWHQRAFQLTRAMSENASTLLWTLVAVHKSMYYIGAPVISNKKKRWFATCHCCNMHHKSTQSWDGSWVQQLHTDSQLHGNYFSRWCSPTNFVPEGIVDSFFSFHFYRRIVTRP